MVIVFHSVRNEMQNTVNENYKNRIRIQGNDILHFHFQRKVTNYTLDRIASFGNQL